MKLSSVSLFFSMRRSNSFSPTFPALSVTVQANFCTPNCVKSTPLKLQVKEENKSPSCLSRTVTYSFKTSISNVSPFFKE